MTAVLAVVMHDRGAVPETTWEAVTAARRVAASMGAPLQAVVIGAGQGAVAEAGTYGCETAHVVTHDVLSDFAPEAWGESVAQLASSTGAAAVIGPGTERGNEVMAHLAARTGLPLVANCTTIEPGAPWRMTRVRWGGSLLEEAELGIDGGPALLTIAPHTVAAEPAAKPATAAATPFTPTLDPSLARTRVVGREEAARGVTLTTAPVVVSGGRGVGSPEGFAVLEELAAMLGGAVGCSRVATNNGWRPHRDQVGQTGTRIAPELYIACGISGAIQHWVGCMASKNILAINTDPEANMVRKADYAVIGDLHEVLDAVVAELRGRESP